MDALAALPAPTELLELRAMRTALVEAALLSVAGGLLGGWIVLRRLAFFAHAAGTATFPGLVLAEATGFSAALVALATALGFAGGVERAGRRGRDPGDAATALVLVVALGAGVVLASDVFESGAAIDRLLFGTVVGLGGADLAMSAAAAAAALAATALLGRAWAATGFDPEGAPALGLPVARADGLLLALVALAVVSALPAVGALLVSSLFVVPAATARLFAGSVGALLAGSVVVAAVQAATGLYVSLWLDVAPGPAVAVVGSAGFALCAFAAALTRVVRPHPLAAEGIG